MKAMTKEVQLSGEGCSLPAGQHLAAASCRAEVLSSHMEVEDKLAECSKEPLILAATGGGGASIA